MKKENLLLELSHFGDEVLSVNNKMQEAINLARDGKWYHSDTKMQGTKQKLMNLYSGVQSLMKEIEDENSTD